MHPRRLRAGRQAQEHDRQWRVDRYYEPAPLELDGREIPRGFGVLEGRYQTFRNPLDQLPVGRRGMVNIELWRQVAWNTPEERLEYLVVTEPIPSGTTVIEKSVTGPFEHFEIGPGEITFYIGSRPGLGTIHYELYGYVPGKYRVGPTIVRNAHRPEQLLATAAEDADRACRKARSRPTLTASRRRSFTSWANGWRPRGRIRGRL